jgi:hypothetical protein
VSNAVKQTTKKECDKKSRERKNDEELMHSTDQEIYG